MRPLKLSSSRLQPPWHVDHSAMYADKNAIDIEQASHASLASKRPENSRLFSSVLRPLKAGQRRRLTCIIVTTSRSGQVGQDRWCGERSPDVHPWVQFESVGDPP